MPANLPLITAQYQVNCVETILTGGPKDLILEANPNRWYLKIIAGQGAAGQFAMPGAYQGLVAGVNGAGLPQEYKFKDCPPLVTGEWYGNGMAATTIICIEVIFLKD